MTPNRPPQHSYAFLMQEPHQSCSILFAPQISPFHDTQGPLSGIL